jgi:hypothetical protein
MNLDVKNKISLKIYRKTKKEEKKKKKFNKKKNQKKLKKKVILTAVGLEPTTFGTVDQHSTN